MPEPPDEGSVGATPNETATVIADTATPGQIIPDDETPEARLDRLFGALANAEGDAADRIADEITSVWARSGSASMDLLLQRARAATGEKSYDKARAHVSALTRLAPDFAEGWNASATLYFIQEDYWLSVEHIQKTLELEPRHFGALAGLALILERTDRDAAALRTWEKVKALFPGMESAQEAIDRLKPDVDGKKT
ncbi:MAG: hypothetical protein P8Q48_18900 [Paracoccaceae bacterium]|nr:hypothetical protein [Paracoccaceae bacterium]MDG1372269.1 hypothetical protein [Paracoccaceae bacterium]